MSTENLHEPTIDVKMGIIEYAGHPKVLELGKPGEENHLIYSRGPWTSMWNGNKVEVESIWAYRDPSGKPRVLLPDVTAIVEEEMAEAYRNAGRRDIANDMIKIIKRMRRGMRIQRALAWLGIR